VGEEDVFAAGRDAAELERQAPVAARLADGAGTIVFKIIPSSQPGSRTIVASSISSRAWMWKRDSKYRPLRTLSGE
jgi:hypothetical protein